MNLPNSPIAASIKPLSESRQEVTLESESFHHQAQIKLEGIPHRMEDNFFDLEPGVPYKVGCCAAKGLSLKRVQAALSVRSLVHTYL